VALLVLALVLRVAFIFYLEPGRIYFRDTVKYTAAAESLLAGEGFGDTYARQPLYPVYLAGVFALFPERLLAAQLADAFLGCLVVFLTYRLGRRIWTDEVGLLGAGFVAVHPYLVILPAFIYAELLFTSLLLASCALLIRVSTARKALAAGAVAGLATLAKASGLALLLGGPLWLLLWGGGRLQRRFLLAACFVSGGVLLVLPWVVRNLEHYHNLTLIEARKEIHVSYDPQASFPLSVAVEHHRIVPGEGPERPRRPNGRPLNVQHVVRQLGAFWALWPDNLATAGREVRERAARKDPRAVVEGHPVDRMARHRLWLSVVLLPYYVCAGLGLWRGRRRESWLLILLVLAFALGRALFVAKLRYRLPIEPAVALFAAVGVVAMVRGLLDGRASRRHVADAPAPEPIQLVSADRL
jgi:4-amino-4-deoxy-L-arabinose transferase-like glycosyltransferase